MLLAESQPSAGQPEAGLGIGLSLGYRQGAVALGQG